MWADVAAMAATDTFMISYGFDVHVAGLGACTAFVASALVYLDPHKGNLCKEGVKGSQRTDESAKTAKDKDHGNETKDEKGNLPSV